MHLISTLPTAIALPTLALIVHFQGYFNNYKLLNWSSIKPNISGRNVNVTNEELLSSCNCTSAIISNEELTIISKLIEVNIAKGNRAKVIEMLDTFEWIDVKPNYSNENDVFLYQKITNILSEKSSLISFILINLCSWIAYRFILNNTLFGILLNIATKRLKRFIRRPFDSCKMYLTYLNNKESIDDGEEIFLDCSSTNNMKKLKNIDSEEVLARAHQPDEKDHDTDVDYDNGYESFVQCICSSDSRLNSTLNSTSRNDYVDVSYSPEKFKQFLHQKNETIEKLGITPITFTEDGYIEEQDSFLDGEGEGHLSVY